MFNANTMKDEREKNKRKYIKKAIKLITKRIKEEVRLGNTFLIFSTLWIDNKIDSDLWHYSSVRGEILRHFSNLGFKTTSETNSCGLIITTIDWEG